MAVTEEIATIPMTVRLTSKFYEPIIFLKALNIEMARTAQYTSPAGARIFDDPRELLKTYIYKLALVCDCEKGNGGGTITSFVVLQMAQTQRVKYWFASNQRTDDELKQTDIFVRSLFKEIGDSSSRTMNQPDEHRKSLLRRILLFNKHRVGCYLRELRSETDKCLRNCSHWSIEERLSISARLREIMSVSAFTWDSYPSGSQIEGFEALIRTLQDFIRSEPWQSLNVLARDVRVEPEETLDCWPEMRHMVNRILAYPQAVKFFLEANSRWPQLFQNPEVVYSKSCKPMSPRPGRNKSYNAAGIIGRMTRKEEEIKIFQNLVEELQLYSLDQRIKSEFQKDTFHPIVHSEVILLHILDQHGLLKPENFFQGFMYVGSSKPPCRLCEYYFEEHKSGVGLRKGHKNLYTSWRVPDVLQTEGTEGEKKRQIMFDRVLNRVRKDAFELIRKKVKPTYRDHDSVTSSARLTHLHLRVADVEHEDLASTMGDLGIEDSGDEQEGGVKLPKL